MSDLDYDDLGFMAGVELHQQISSETKLFCNCTTDIDRENEAPYTAVNRFLRPTTSELGEVDPAAAFEHVKNNQFQYNVYHDTSCLVELDEEPPHPLDREALNTALTFARLVNCDLPDEIHVMRKIVIDGSNTTGFQRTAITGLNGEIETEQGTVRIPDIELEEESSGIHTRTEEKSVYDLNRLGIPLIEVGTAPDIQNPEHAKEVALKLGMLLRSTENVKRGLGTVRQDVNVSIEEGARVEIKGFQDVKNMDTVIEKEVERQHTLVQLKNNLNPIDTGDVHDVTQLVHSTDDAADFLHSAEHVAALPVKKQAGLLTTELCEGKTLGNEIADYARATGVNGLIHTDENLEKYGLNTIVSDLRSQVDAGEDDLVLLVASTEPQATAALTQVEKRVEQLPRMVPEETRDANEDFTTSYLRPLPGEARMYPETDIPAIPITQDDVDRIDDALPDTLEEREEALREDVGEELASQLVTSPYLATAEQIMDTTDVDVKTVAVFFTQTLPDLQTREGTPIQNLTVEHFTALFAAVEDDELVDDHLAVVAQYLAEHPDQDVVDAVEAQGLEAVDEEEIRSVVQTVVEENEDVVMEQGMHAKGMLMGQVMEELGGSASGEDVSQILDEALEEKVEG